MRKKGLVFVVSAPSGAGKSTLAKRVFKTISGLEFSISYTTRKPRAHEVDAVDYFFTDRNTFEKMVSEERFIEWAEVHDELYGTPKDYIQNKIDSGCDVILDIDVNGAQQIKKSGIDAIFIFILPPSIDVLKKRLIGRNTENRDAQKLRLENAIREMDEANRYDYIVVNDDISNATHIITSIIIAERHR
ncbi:MAG: guanylate kinase, partial [Thermodesulfobacteriota bacterium]|nr:guanylate kinase [Thermodesulfobacteriota bacterium]